MHWWVLRCGNWQISLELTLCQRRWRGNHISGAWYFYVRVGYISIVRLLDAWPIRCRGNLRIWHSKRLDSLGSLWHNSLLQYVAFSSFCFLLAQGAGTCITIWRLHYPFIEQWEGLAFRKHFFDELFFLNIGEFALAHFFYVLFWE